MTDLEQRGYLERHAPANLEFDQVPMRVEIRISGSSRTHRLYTNGRSGAGWGQRLAGHVPGLLHLLVLLSARDRPPHVRPGRELHGNGAEIPSRPTGSKGRR